MNNSIRMEVGIEDCLHIEFEYAKAKYSLRGVVVGKIYFLLVRIKIKHMELEIRRREHRERGEHAQRERDDSKVRSHGRCASARGIDPRAVVLSPVAIWP